MMCVASSSLEEEQKKNQTDKYISVVQVQHSIHPASRQIILNQDFCYLSPITLLIRYLTLRIASAYTV